MKAIHLAKNIRLTGTLRSAIRIHGSYLLSVGMVKYNVAVSEIHVNRSRPTSERVLTIDCDSRNASLVALLQSLSTTETTHLTFVAPDHHFTMELIRFSSQTRLVSEPGNSQSDAGSIRQLFVDNQKAADLQLVSQESLLNTEEYFVFDLDENTEIELLKCSTDSTLSTRCRVQ
ncbi:hypothetical protein Pan181_13840 [Aeoliella mucimassa]|uniref:Uncharacterized protein n=1 Tax=Aeoliella mucimassa TaxID=2527972 RepID=A0A518AKD4_9BACT|nr:hypothetical protein Pan181_13840 [Aeoliella mucimassa]